MQRIIVKNTTISNRWQTAVPALARKALTLEKGNQLVWIIKTGTQRPQITIRPKTKNYGDYLSGLGKNLWKDEKTETYLNNLRKEWDRKNQ